MENAIRQRVKEVLKDNNKTLSACANGNSAIQMRFSRQLSQKSAITFETISLFLECFPNVNKEWLLFGDGGMYLNDTLPKITGNENENELELHAELAKKTKKVQKLEEELMEAKDRIDELQDLVKFQREKIRDLEGIIPRKKSV